MRTAAKIIAGISTVALAGGIGAGLAYADPADPTPTPTTTASASPSEKAKPKDAKPKDEDRQRRGLLATALHGEVTSPGGHRWRLPSRTGREGGPDLAHGESSDGTPPLAIGTERGRKNGEAPPRLTSRPRPDPGPGGQDGSILKALGSCVVLAALAFGGSLAPTRRIARPIRVVGPAGLHHLALSRRRPYLDLVAISSGASWSVAPTRRPSGIVPTHCPRPVVRRPYRLRLPVVAHLLVGLLEGRRTRPDAPPLVPVVGVEAESCVLANVRWAVRRRRRGPQLS